uniref:Uncharacterized protein n=1 Tax=viral metagenome TaxID=1070528 RepID=A0A2V0RH57_9ZZZZ
MSRKRTKTKEEANIGDKDVVPATAGQKASNNAKQSKPWMKKGKGKPAAKAHPLDSTPGQPKGTTPEVPEKPSVKSLHDLRNELIIPGFGMSVPAFRRYSNTDAETYIPLGVQHGYFLPVGQQANTELYPQLSDLFLQRILTRLTNLGYENDYNVLQLREFFNGVALGVQMVRFITELRTMQRFGEIHSSGPVSSMCTSAINGRLVAQHRRAIKLIAALPFDPKWEEAYIQGFGATTMSDSPFGPIRMFAPKLFQPDDNTAYEATAIANALQAALDGFFTNQVNTELASILSVIYPPRPELPEVLDTHFTYNPASVNNILNLPFNDGTTTAPAFSDTQTVRYFYRRAVVKHGMYTYAPDNNVIAILQGTVWAHRSGAGENVESSIAVNNDATAIPVAQDGELWSTFGRVWNADVGLIDSPAPSVAHVFTTMTGVATGVADDLLNS